MSCTVSFVSLGCAKNLVNTEQMMALCRQAGFTLVGDPAQARVVVLNTCGFIESAKSEAIDHILELAQLKGNGTTEKLLVAGCLPQRYPADLPPALPHRQPTKNPSSVEDGFHTQTLTIQTMQWLNFLLIVLDTKVGQNNAPDNRHK